MGTVLVIAYYFPPEGGPAVQRTLKFVKYLNSFGYKSIVVTAHHFAKIIDKPLLIDVPSSTITYRIFDFGSIIPDFIREKIFGKNYIDKHQLWNYSLKLFAKWFLRKHKIDIIFSTTPPHSVNLAVSYISYKYNIPWVADFRDEWTNDPNFGKQKNREQIITLEKNILRNAEAITTVTQKGKNNFENISSKPDKSFCIYNGFDPDDYNHLTSDKTITNEKLSIAYTGRLTKKSSPDYLFKVLDNLIKNGKLDFNKINFTIVGPEGNKKWIEKFKHLCKYVKFINYQPHSISSQMLADSDVLLLLASNTLGSEVFTGKVFEYFYLLKPILVIIRYPGELSKLLSNHGNVYVAIENIQNSVEDTFLNMYNDWINNQLNKEIDINFINTFNRRDQAQQLANIFDDIINRNKN